VNVAPPMTPEAFAAYVRASTRATASCLKELGIDK
jgi:hypothetical protein